MVSEFTVAETPFWPRMNMDYTVLTEGDDQQDPIADSARAILDGHIVLSDSSFFHVLTNHSITIAFTTHSSISNHMRSSHRHQR